MTKSSLCREHLLDALPSFGARQHGEPRHLMRGARLPHPIAAEARGGQVVHGDQGRRHPEQRALSNVIPHIQAIGGALVRVGTALFGVRLPAA